MAPPSDVRLLRRRRAVSALLTPILGACRVCAGGQGTGSDHLVGERGLSVAPSCRVTCQQLACASEADSSARRAWGRPAGPGV